MGAPVTVKPLGARKSLVDATSKFAVLTQDCKPKAVIVFSRSASPHLVMRGAELAAEIRGMLGTDLGRALPVPLETGYAAGRSYMILPWYRDFSGCRPMRALQRMTLTGTLLGWLRQANATAATALKAWDTDGYADSLEHLGRQSFCDREMQIAIRTSLRRLECGFWRPRHTVDHNDLWLGNVMLSRHEGYPGQYASFVIIDWAGANARGFGILDLLWLAQSLKIGARRLGVELTAHSLGLDCDLVDTQGHLLAGLGRMHRHIEHFPEDSYVGMVRSCWRLLSSVIPPH